MLQARQIRRLRPTSPGAATLFPGEAIFPQEFQGAPYSG